MPLRVPHEATDIFLSAAIPGGYGWLFPKGEVANLGLSVASAANARLKPLLEGLNAAVISGDLAGRAAADYLGGEVAALDDYAEQLEETFGSALARAIRRRPEILEAYETGPGPDPTGLRRGWIAYPDYWAT